MTTSSLAETLVHHRLAGVFQTTLVESCIVSSSTVRVQLVGITQIVLLPLAECES